MSGGSMDYLSYKVHDAQFEEHTPLRRAFRKHLEKVAKALHEIEWADSGDSVPDNEEERAAIRACLGPAAELAHLIKEATEIKKAMERLIKVSRKKAPND